LLAILNLVWSFRKNEPAGSNPWESKELEWTGNYSGRSSTSHFSMPNETSVEPPRTNEHSEISMEAEK
jgi:hypothetical protein